MTKIAWTDVTWNPVVGCSRVSAGCDHCYAMGVAHRKMQPAHVGLTKLRPKDSARPGVDWNGSVRFLPDRLGDPIARRKAKLIFVNSMSDLFHEQLSDLQIAAVFGVMLMADHHTFQVLTKRLSRARAWYRTLNETAPRLFGDKVNKIWEANGRRVNPDPRVLACVYAAERFGVKAPDLASATRAYGTWPPPSVQLLASVEDQRTAEERIPLLLECLAEVRGVSYEPALGPVDLAEYLRIDGCHTTPDGERFPALCTVCGGRGMPRLDWVIVGGESGPAARSFNVAWARLVIEQGREAGVPVFVKQLGAKPYHCAGHDRPAAMGNGPSIDCGGRNSLCVPWLFDDGSASDPSEWPKHLRVRKFPRATPT